MAAPDTCEARRAKNRASSGRAKISRRRKARGGRAVRDAPAVAGRSAKNCLRRPVSPGHGSRRLAASGLREPLPIVRVTDACAILGYCGPGFQSLHMSFAKPCGSSKFSCVSAQRREAQTGDAPPDQGTRVVRPAGSVLRRRRSTLSRALA